LNQQQRVRVIGEWLCRYSLVFRDATAQPSQISAATVDAYASFLGDCEPAALQEAMRLAGANARFFPRPQEIRVAYIAVLERANARGPSCSLCGGCGYVQGEKGWSRCQICSPGTGENEREA
jgi:hypothetical protein